jgi:hypothetical protein
MTETDERAGDGGGGVAPESGAAGGNEATPRAEAESGRPGDEAAELRAEEESAKAMEAEVPHPSGYEDTGQEPPSGSEQEPPEDSGQGQSS